MTPDLVTAVFAGIAVVITALTALIYQVGKLRKQAKDIDDKADLIHADTNGAAAAASAEMKALREKVHKLEEEIVENTASRVIERLAAQQAAADVRVALEKAPPTDPPSGTR